MTTSTIAAGWFLFAGALMSLGALIVWVCCSEWAESRARKAERIIGVRAELADLEAAVTREEAEWDRFLNTVVTERPRPAIPMQRRGESS